MTTFFSTMRLAAFVVAAVLAIPAHATVVHSVTMRVDGMSLFNPATGEVSFPASSMFPGSEIALGDSMSALLFYDETTAPQSSMPADGNIGSASWYRPNGFSVMFNWRTGVVWEFFGRQEENIVAVLDNMEWGWDILSIAHHGEQGGEFIHSLDWSFMNVDGTAFSDSSVPLELDLSRFAHANFNSTWIRASDGMQFGIHGDITSLMYLPPYVEPVPEPSGIYLFLAAAGIAALRFRKRAA